MDCVYTTKYKQGFYCMRNNVIVTCMCVLNVMNLFNNFLAAVKWRGNFYWCSILTVNHNYFGRNPKIHAVYLMRVPLHDQRNIQVNTDMLNSDFELHGAFHVLCVYVCACVRPKVVNQTPWLAHNLRSAFGSSVGSVRLFAAAVGAHYVISLTDVLWNATGVYSCLRTGGLLHARPNPATFRISRRSII
jgi:predicted Rdx family selenoprotein